MAKKRSYIRRPTRKKFRGIRQRRRRVNNALTILKLEKEINGS